MRRVSHSLLRSTGTSCRRRTIQQSSLRWAQLSTDASSLTDVSSLQNRLEYSARRQPKKTRSSTTINEETRAWNVSTSSGRTFPHVEGQNTENLLDIETYPIGSLTPTLWSQGHELLAFWVKQRTADSVDFSFRLWDRLWQEQVHLETDCVQRSTGDSHPPSTWLTTPLNSEMLCTLVNNWRVWSWNQHPDLNKQNPQLTVKERYNAPYVQALVERCSSLLNEKVYYLILDGTRRSGNPAQVADLASDLLAASIHRWKTQMNPSCRPSTELYNSALLAWSRSNRNTAITMVEKLWAQMQEHNIAPDSRSYERIIGAHISSTTPSRSEKAEYWLRKMEQDHTVCISTRAYTSVIAAQDDCAKAEQLLEELLDLKAQSIDNPNSTQDSQFHPGDQDVPGAVNATLQCHIRAANVERAQDILYRMRDLGYIDVLSYRTVMLGWLKASQPVQCQAILQSALESYRDGLCGVCPSDELVALAVSAWAKSSHPKNVEQAMALLKSLTSSEWDHIDMQVTTSTMNALLEVLIRSKDYGDIQKAEELLRHIKGFSKKDASKAAMAPNESSYNLMIGGWARLGQPVKARAWLEEMYKDYQEGSIETMPGLKTFNTVLASYIRSRDRHAAENAWEFLKAIQKQCDEGRLPFELDVYSYTSVLSALSNAWDLKKYGETAQRAEDLLNEMNHRYGQGQASVRPNTISYNAVMNGWARAKNPEKAAAVLQKMYADVKKEGNINALPDDKTFNTLIKAFALSQDPGAPEKAEEILRHMVEQYELGASNVKPTVVTYTTVILCYGLAKHLKAPYRADELLQLIKGLHQRGELDDGPSRSTYQVVRKAWEFSTHAKKRERISELDREYVALFGQTNDSPRSGSGRPRKDYPNRNMKGKRDKRLQPDKLRDEQSHISRRKSSIKEE
jgi:pentatricopeptide repeat protein